MKIMVVGGGGREHAIIKKLKENSEITEVFALPGNGGIAKDATCVNIGATDIEKIVSFAKETEIDYAVVAPDDPLVLGCVDELEKIGVPCFGPRADAAIIEGSKVFSKNLMKKYNIPTAKYEVFNDPKNALEYIKDNNTYPIVIKADGLALGKGVIIAESFEMASDAIDSIMNSKIFGNSGNQVVIEEFITGPEVSVLAFTDGVAIAPMVSSMDHKRAFTGDLGPNTGGMGTISPNPFYTDEVAKECYDTIFIPTLRAMEKEGRKFKGCLYFGLMLTKDGPRVIEYNARFGDPETQVVLPRLKTDLIDIIDAVIDEKLGDLAIEWDNGASACVIMASGGYPGSYEKGKIINGLDENGQVDGVTVYHAGTKLSDGNIVTSGGRVLGITGKGENLEEALNKAYAAVSKISFDGAFWRTDIGRKTLS